MQRDRRLRALSSDHHQALVLARRASTVAALGDAAAARSLWDEVVRRFQDELAPHFAIEEQHLLPAVERCGGVGPAARTREEHAALRRLIFDDPQDRATRLARFGELLRDHVRFEERVLFALAQGLLGDAALEAVADACASREPGAHRTTGPDVHGEYGQRSS